MAKPSKLLEQIKSLREKITFSPVAQNNTFLLLLMEKIKALELMLLNSELKQELAILKNQPVAAQVQETKDNSHLSLKEKTERLVKVATTKTVEGKTLFLLHRPTEDFEYEKGINNEKSEFTTHKESEWIADFEESTVQRIGNNPVIAAWVPEADIKDVPNAFSSEDNTWGDLGTNPNKNKYRVIVQAGTYKLYQELKKSKSIYTLMRGIEALKKSSQFVKLPPELLKIGQKEKQFNTKEDGISMDKAKSLFSEGKLKKFQYYVAAPTKVGQISPDGEFVAIKHPIHGKPVWEAKEENKQKLDANLHLNINRYLDKFPKEHRPVVVEFMKHVMTDPLRHLRTAWDKPGELKIRARHLKGLMLGNPNFRLVVHNPDRLTFTIHERNGKGGLGGNTWKFTLDQGLQKSLAKPEQEQEIPQIASVAVIHGDKLLMGKRNDTLKYTLPGGGLRAGEQPIQAAYRELMEEVGIQPKELYYMGSKNVICQDGKNRMIHAFVCFGEYNINNELDPNEEVQNWEWVDCGKGLPQQIAAKLHSPKNVVLKFLGLQDD